VPHNIFDDHAFPGSRPQPWRPALGEGSAAINHARFLDALAGRRHAPTPTPKCGKIIGGLPINDYHRQHKAEYREQERIAAEMRLRAPGASLDRAAYMRDQRIVLGRGEHGRARKFEFKTRPQNDGRKTRTRADTQAAQKNHDRYERRKANGYYQRYRRPTP
jgi:hypothetical protein